MLVENFSMRLNIIIFKLSLQIILTFKNMFNLFLVLVVISSYVDGEYIFSNRL